MNDSPEHKSHATSGSSNPSRSGSSNTSASGSAEMSRSASNDSSQSESGNSSRDQLMENVQNLANHADALMKATASVSTEGVAMARRNLEESLQAVRSQLDRLQKMATERAMQAVKAADSYVHDHPWQAVGVAAVMGFFVSLLGGMTLRRAVR